MSKGGRPTADRKHESRIKKRDAETDGVTEIEALSGAVIIFEDAPGGSERILFFLSDGARNAVRNAMSQIEEDHPKIKLLDREIGGQARTRDHHIRVGGVGKKVSAFGLRITEYAVHLLPREIFFPFDTNSVAPGEVNKKLEKEFEIAEHREEIKPDIYVALRERVENKLAREAERKGKRERENSPSSSAQAGTASGSKSQQPQNEI